MKSAGAGKTEMGMPRGITINVLRYQILSVEIRTTVKMERIDEYVLNRKRE